jgi:hypothetical protein
VIKAGIEIHQYQPTVFHRKVRVIDDFLDRRNAISRLSARITFCGDPVPDARLFFFRHEYPIGDFDDRAAAAAAYVVECG